MKFILITLFLLLSGVQLTHAQRSIDSLTKLLAHSDEDTNKVLMLIELAGNYQFSASDTALVLTDEAIQLARKIKYDKGELRAISRQGEVRHLRGELPLALESELTAIQLSQKYNYPDVEAESLTFLATIYLDLAEYRQALNYLFKAKKIYDNINIKLLRYDAKQIAPYALSNIGYAFEKLNLIDSAMYYYKLVLSNPFDFDDQQRADIIGKIGIVESRQRHYKEAFGYFREAITITEISNDYLNRCVALQQIALIFKDQNNIDSAIHYALLALKSGEKSTYKTAILDASSLLATLYKTKGNLDSAFYYQQTATNTKDSLFGLDKFHKLQLVTLSEQQRVQQLREQQELLKTRMQLAGLLFSVGVFLLIAFTFWHSNRQQKKANQLLNEKNLQIEKQSESLKNTLHELKSTQAQLIQSEKMASLGELTAGIAHEIQNPLNFVNNFSEVSNELIDEMKTELATGNSQEAIMIADYVKQNLVKILHHGKRADAIVKGMLQHSQTSTGKKELTNINKLADEYLHLSYQGLRAKDKNFNAILKTDFDESIGNINIIPQDIGRVLLNLFNNAFYAVAEKKNTSTGLPAAQASSMLNEEVYEPTVTVSTKRINDKVKISVKDNGNGIPQKVVDKIFQPFFTTKPTGQGTGLGLSLSYDIIKAHGGEIKVETKEGEGTAFIIQLNM